MTQIYILIKYIIFNIKKNIWESDWDQIKVIESMKH